MLNVWLMIYLKSSVYRVQCMVHGIQQVGVRVGLNPICSTSLLLGKKVRLSPVKNKINIIKIMLIRCNIVNTTTTGYKWKRDEKLLGSSCRLPYLIFPNQQNYTARWRSWHLTSPISQSSLVRIQPSLPFIARWCKCSTVTPILSLMLVQIQPLRPYIISFSSLVDRASSSCGEGIGSNPI